MAGVQRAPADPEGERVVAVLGRLDLSLVHGLAFSLAYALLLFPLFRWKNSIGMNIVKALVFAVVLATISAVWWVPQLFPAFNPGFFSWNLGWKTVFGIYLWHLIYGLNLGAFYSPLPDEAG